MTLRGLRRMSKRRRGWAVGLVMWGAVLILDPAPSAADGAQGSARDQLDWSGASTDRYLDGEEVVAVLHRGAEDFAACAAGQVPQRDSEAPLWLSFGVDPQGRAANVQLDGLGATSGPGQCLLRVLGGLQFGDHDGLPGRYSYPLILQLQEGVVRNLPYPIVLVTVADLRLPLLSLPLDISPEDLAAIEASLAPKEP